MLALYFQIAAQTRTLGRHSATEDAMDRTLRPIKENKAIEHHHRVIGTEPQETSHSRGAPRVERFTSGILRELAEQMRHWD